MSRVRTSSPAPRSSRRADVEGRADRVDRCRPMLATSPRAHRVVGGDRPAAIRPVVARRIPDMAKTTPRQGRPAHRCGGRDRLADGATIGRRGPSCRARRHRRPRDSPPISRARRPHARHRGRRDFDCGSRASRGGDNRAIWTTGRGDRQRRHRDPRAARRHAHGRRRARHRCQPARRLEDRPGRTTRGDRSRGYILVVSSVSGATPGPFNAAYNAAKAGVAAMAKTLRLEVRGQRSARRHRLFRLHRYRRRPPRCRESRDGRRDGPSTREDALPEPRRSCGCRSVRAVERRSSRVVVPRSLTPAIEIRERLQSVAERWLGRGQIRWRNL